MARGKLAEWNIEPNAATVKGIIRDDAFETLLGYLAKGTPYQIWAHIMPDGPMQRAADPDFVLDRYFITNATRYWINMRESQPETDWAYYLTIHPIDQK